MHGHLYWTGEGLERESKTGSDGSRNDGNSERLLDSECVEKRTTVKRERREPLEVADRAIGNGKVVLWWWKRTEPRRAEGTLGAYIRARM